MKILHTLIISIGLSLMGLNAQWPDNRESNLIISGVPQYIAVNAIRIDVDIRQKESNKWFVLSPYYYAKNTMGDFFHLEGSDDHYDPYSYDDMWGVGLGISRRTYFSKTLVGEGLYLSYGLNYKYFDLSGNNYIWTEYTGFDGLPYQHMENIPYTVHIQSGGATAELGYQVQMAPAWYMDFYMGFGIKYSHHSSPQNVTVKYNRGVNDYGYTGTHFVGGLRMGFGL